MGRKPLDKEKLRQINVKLPLRYCSWLEEQLEEYQTLADFVRRILVRYAKANGFKDKTDKSKSK